MSSAITNHIPHSKTKLSKLALLFWFLGASFVGYEFFLRVSPGVMQGGMKSFFSISATELGFLASAYYYAYALFQVPSGLMIDRYGARIWLTIGCLLCGGGALMMALANNFPLAIVGRLSIGAGSAFALVGTLKIATEWFSPARYGVLSGLTLTIGTLGALMGGAPLANLVTHFGWQEVLLITGAAGLCLAIVLYALMRDNQEALLDTDAGDAKVWTCVWEVVKNGQSWIPGIFGGALYIPICIIGELWGTPFMMQQCQTSVGEAAGVVSLIFGGLAVGSPFFGWLSDTLRRRKSVAIGGTFLALITSLLIIWLPTQSIAVFSVLIALLGVFLGCQILMFPIVREVNPSHVEGFTAGFCNMVAMVITSFSLPLVGKILDIYNPQEQCLEISSYSLESLRFGLGLVPVTLLLTLVVLFFVRETYARPADAKAPTDSPMAEERV